MLNARYRSPLLAAAVFTFASPAMAAEASAEDPMIVVTATGSDIPAEQAGQSISVIDAAEIAAVQGQDLTRVLERFPGVSFQRNGGLGSTTSVFVRGANSQQLLVLVDGIRIEDEAAPSGGTDFGGLLAGGIGRIELLRGSNSVVWGSDAIGGVMAITSRQVDGADAAVEYGSHNSVNAQTTVGIVRDNHDFTIGAGYSRTDGISAVAVGTEPDGFEQWRVSARGSIAVAPGLRVFAAGRYADSTIDYDNSFPLSDAPWYQVSRQAAVRAGVSYRQGALDLTAALAYSQNRRTYFDPSVSADPNYLTWGRNLRAELVGKLALPAGFALNFGADSQWSRFTAVDPDLTWGGTDLGKNRLASGHALLSWHGERIDLAAGARVDDHSSFGNHWSFGANGSLRLVRDVRLRACYGEGFKAPSLYQLMARFYGNAALRPETSHSYDVGIEKGERDGALHAAVSWFSRNTANLIDFVGSGYVNVARAHAEGVEIELDARPTGHLGLHAVYSHVTSTDRTAGSGFGRNLPRRPRDLLTLAGDWQTPLAGLTLGVDTRLAGNSFDDAANAVRLASYVVVDLRASVPLNDRIELFGRIENLGDTRYQTAAGYNTASRAAYIGVRGRL